MTDISFLVWLTYAVIIVTALIGYPSLVLAAVLWPINRWHPAPTTHKWMVLFAQLGLAVVRGGVFFVIGGLVLLLAGILATFG